MSFAHLGSTQNAWIDWMIFEPEILFTDITLYNVTFYNEVISSCNGKMQCDELLQAIAGPPIGQCYDNSMRLPDYVAVDYYCESGIFIFNNNCAS